FPALSSTRTRYPVIGEPPSVAGAVHRTVADALPKLAAPIAGAAGTVAGGGVTVAGGPTATPSGLKVRMKFCSAPVPSVLARPIASSTAFGSELRFTWVQYRCPASTARPSGKDPASMKFGLTPVPSMPARPIVPPLLTQ